MPHKRATSLLSEKTTCRECLDFPPLTLVLFCISVGAFCRCDAQTMTSRVFNLTFAITGCCAISFCAKPSIRSSEGGPDAEQKKSFGSTSSGSSNPHDWQPSIANAYTPPLSRAPLAHEATVAKCQNICQANRASGTVIVRNHLWTPQTSRISCSTTKRRTLSSATTTFLHAQEHVNILYCQVPCTHEYSQSVNWRVAGECYAGVE